MPNRIFQKKKKKKKKKNYVTTTSVGARLYLNQYSYKNSYKSR